MYNTVTVLRTICDQKTYIAMHRIGVYTTVDSDSCTETRLNVCSRVSKRIAVCCRALCQQMLNIYKTYDQTGC